MTHTRGRAATPPGAGRGTGAAPARRPGRAAVERRLRETNRSAATGGPVKPAAAVPAAAFGGLVASLLLLAAAAAPAAAWTGLAPLRAPGPPPRLLAHTEPDSTGPGLVFEPFHGDSFGAGEEPIQVVDEEGIWLRAPFGDQLLTDRDAWGDAGRRHRSDVELDYNRVDRLRLSAHLEWQSRNRMQPRLGARWGYAFDRERAVYGIQLEQPVLPPGRLAFGLSMVRRTDHNDVQLIDDFENTLALLLFRKDYRDYFEREGFGAYLAWRVPDFSTVSLHLRNDEYRTLPTQWSTRSWLNRDEPLRGNPAVSDGTIHGVLLRLERLAHRTHRTRAGFYHWIELERAGGALEGDFGYSRVLADVRSVLRLSPGTTLALRGLAGHGWDADSLPRQKQFLVGGVDGLRAHPFGAFRGSQVALIQAEYSLSLWQLDRGRFEGGLQALAFIEAGRAWDSASGRWDLNRQPLAADGGFGLATQDDGLRLYFARDLKDPSSELVMSLRLQRPF